MSVAAVAQGCKFNNTVNSQSSKSFKTNAMNTYDRYGAAGGVNKSLSHMIPADV